MMEDNYFVLGNEFILRGYYVMHFHATHRRRGGPRRSRSHKLQQRQFQVYLHLRKTEISL